jgi:hypothetical protein
MSAGATPKRAAAAPIDTGPHARKTFLRPLARVERISLFEREVKERLSRAAMDVIFAAAGVMSEGQRAARGGREVFFGSTMLTIELEAVARVVRDAADARAAQRLAALLSTDAGALARIKSIAAEEAERLTGARPRSLNPDVKVRARGTTVYVDVDLEASF